VQHIHVGVCVWGGRGEGRGGYLIGIGKIGLGKIQRASCMPFNLGGVNVQL